MYVHTFYMLAYGYYVYAYDKIINLWGKEAQEDSVIMTGPKAHLKLDNRENQTRLIITNDKVS